jgi:hypothetical protein
MPLEAAAGMRRIISDATDGVDPDEGPGIVSDAMDGVGRRQRGRPDEGPGIVSDAMDGVGRRQGAGRTKALASPYARVGARANSTENARHHTTAVE